jgi:hypothetical protein
LIGSFRDHLLLSAEAFCSVLFNRVSLQCAICQFHGDSNFISVGQSSDIFLIAIYTAVQAVAVVGGGGGVLISISTIIYLNWKFVGLHK